MPYELYVIFQLGDEKYAVSTSAVKEIDRTNEISINIVPTVPSYIEGIINLRGDVVPVLDPKKKFGLDSARPGKKQRIIILMQKTYLLGMLVDSVCGTVSISEEELYPPTDEMLEETPYIRAIAKKEDQVIFILDIQKLADPM